MATTLPELRINGSSTAAKDWGVKMGDGFFDSLTEPLTPKDPIENESRLENGKRVLIYPNNIRFKSRELTLDFTIEGRTPEEFKEHKRKFLEEMYKVDVSIQVPRESDDVYHLIFKGKGTEYGMNYQRTFCHMVLKFEEPNPMDRAERAGVTN